MKNGTPSGDFKISYVYSEVDVISVIIRLIA